MPRKKLTKNNKERDIGDIFYSYVNNLDAIEQYVNNLHPIVEANDKKTIEKTIGITKKIIAIVEENNKNIKDKKEIKLTLDQIKRITSFKHDIGVSLIQADMLYRSSFILLISRFDYLISDLISFYLNKFPDQLAEKETPLTLADLKTFDSIKDAIEFSISREVEKILYQNQSLEKQKDYLEKKLRISTHDEIIDWAKINEVMERRHLLVHNNGYINNRYLKNANITYAPEKKRDLSEGKQISINKVYFNNAFNEILLAGIILIQNAWRKWTKEEIRTINIKLNNTMYDFLCKEKWAIVERLGIYSKQYKDIEQEIRLYLDINYCQGLKWQGKDVELGVELKKIDVSALSPKYTLAMCALKNDSKGFYNVLEKAIIVDRMDKTEFMAWPLFRDLRKEKDYALKIDQVFEKISKNQTSD